MFKVKAGMLHKGELFMLEYSIRWRYFCWNTTLVEDVFMWNTLHNANILYAVECKS
jgi:hypothetical protein